MNFYSTITTFYLFFSWNLTISRRSPFFPAAGVKRLLHLGVTIILKAPFFSCLRLSSVGRGCGGRGGYLAVTYLQLLDTEVRVLFLAYRSGAAVGRIEDQAS